MAQEQKIQDKIIKYLEKLDKENEPIFWEKRQAGGFTYRIGLPDLYIVYYGKHIEIEIKAPDGKRSSAQIKWEMKCKQRLIKYGCVKTVEEVKKILESVKEEEYENK